MALALVSEKNIFISSYLMLNLPLSCKLLFLQFLLGYLFLLCNLLSWIRNDLLFFSEDHLDVSGRAHVWALPMNSAGSVLGLGSLVHLDVFNDQKIYI